MGGDLVHTQRDTRKTGHWGRVRTDCLILDSPHAQFPNPSQNESPCPADASWAAYSAPGRFLQQDGA